MNNNLIRVFVAIIFFVTSMHSSVAQTNYTWTGDGDGTSWEDVDNWDLDAEPGAGDVARFYASGGAPTVTGTPTNNPGRIIIANTTVTLDLDITIGNGTQTASGISLSSNQFSTLNMGVAGNNRTITINLGATAQAISFFDGDTADDIHTVIVASSTIVNIQQCGRGLNCYGINDTFTNNGIINISNSSENQIDLDDGGTFINNGTLNLSSSSSSRGIYMRNQGANFNANAGGTITISEGSISGISMYDGTTFINDGDLNITAAATDGIVINAADASFQNASNGDVTITNATTDGIDLVDGTFLNESTIGISASVSNASISVVGGLFDANNGGVISLSNSSVYGIEVSAAGTLENDGVMNIAGGTEGVIVTGASASFDNMDNGDLNITVGSTSGMSMQSSATISNTGTIDLTSTSTNGLELMSGTFNANDGGVINIENTTATSGLYVSDATLNNDGALNVNSSGITEGIRIPGSGSASINNTTNGVITISDISGTGTTLGINQDNGSISNAGTISITSTSADFGVQITGAATSFTNDGVFSISTMANDGINVQSDGFVNNGTLNLSGGGGSNGIAIQGSPVRLFTNNGILNLVGSGGGSDVLIESFGNFLNTGSINCSNGAGSAAFIRFGSTTTAAINDVGASIDLGNSRLTNNNGIFTNNGFVKSSFNGIGLSTNASGTSTNNGFFSYAIGVADDFSSGTGTVVENGLDVDVPGNMTLDAGDTETVTDIGIDVAYSWYDDAGNSTLLATNDAVGLLTFEDISENGAPSHSDQLFTVFGADVVFTVNNVLPVELLFFNLTASREGVLLNWETATELNNEGFELYSSNDGETWNMLAVVEGNGTTTTRSAYSFLDKFAKKGVNYYRLKQVDFDGTFEILDTQVIVWEYSFQSLSVYPNPTANILHLGTHQFPRSSFSLYDLEGNKIAIRWSASDQIVFQDLPKAVYLLKAEINNQVFTSRVIKD